MRPGKAREAKLLWLERDVRHPAAAEQAAGKTRDRQTVTDAGAHGHGQAGD